MDLTDNKSNEEEQHQGLLNGRSNRRTIYGYPEMQHNENQLHKLCVNENDAGSIRVTSISFCKKTGLRMVSWMMIVMSNYALS